jgi:hypothetical protein
MDVYTSIVVGWDETPKSKILKKEMMMFLPFIVETFSLFFFFGGRGGVKHF